MRRALLALLAPLSLIVLGCNIAPPPPPTAPPSSTPLPAPTATPTPTMGPRQFIDAVFCWPSPIDVGSFNLLRFFDDGTLLDVGVAPFADCEEAWRQMSQYLTLENAGQFNHGEYYLSGDIIKFELVSARSNQLMGEVAGAYSGDEMELVKGGATQKYSLVVTEP